MELDKANFITSNTERIDTYYEIKNKKDDVTFNKSIKYPKTFQR